MPPKGAPSRTRLRNVEFEKWAIPGYDEPFVQDPLNFFEKNEFLALVARALEDSLAGGADIEAVLTLLGMEEKQLKALVSGNMEGVDMSYIATSLFNVITRLITTAPRLLEDLYLIALSVPPEKRHEVREQLRQIDDDTGFGILEAFVKQNATTIRDFFPRWRALLESTMESLRAAADTPPTSND